MFFNSTFQFLLILTFFSLKSFYYLLDVVLICDAVPFHVVDEKAKFIIGSEIAIGASLGIIVVVETAFVCVINVLFATEKRNVNFNEEQLLCNFVY